ncbi:hypothetical protein GKC56_04885 [Neisseriaceae bacterium PsAf]|nr:hypothetical protein [Neisseriaceae bacterium PsAf]
MDEKYTLSIHNDSDLSDDWGYIHTWLDVSDGNQKEYISFCANDLEDDRAMAKIGEGRFDGRDLCGDSLCDKDAKPTDRYYDRRPPSESYTFDISKEKYDKILSQYKTLTELKIKPTYEATGRRKGCYNCTTFARELLLHVDIDVLKHARSPLSVKKIIKALENNLSIPSLEELELSNQTDLPIGRGLRRHALNTKLKE